MNEAVDYPGQLLAIYQTRRDLLIEGLNRIGWDVKAPKGSMFVWAPIPEPYLEMGSLEFARFLIELRTQQAVRNLRKALTKLG